MEEEVQILKKKKKLYYLPLAVLGLCFSEGFL